MLLFEMAVEFNSFPRLLGSVDVSSERAKLGDAMCIWSWSSCCVGLCWWAVKGFLSAVLARMWWSVQSVSIQ